MASSGYSKGGSGDRFGYDERPRGLPNRGGQDGRAPRGIPEQVSCLNIQGPRRSDTRADTVGRGTHREVVAMPGEKSALQPRDAVIVGYVRTPIGRHAGALAKLRPDSMAGQAIAALVERTGIDPAR